MGYNCGAEESSADESRLIEANIAHKDLRADVWLAKELDISRANMQKLMNSGLVLADGKVVKQNYRVKGSELFTVFYQPPVPLEVEPEALPLDILYENKDMIVVNKARGMVVHPAVGHFSGTLVNVLLHHCRDLSGINGIIRPGIVHRLDKDTSGVMVVAKNDTAHVDLATQIQKKTASREYLALVHGRLKTESGQIETLLGRDPKDRQKMAVVAKNGREAVTFYQVEEYFKQHTLVRLRLLTGRTHQIRVHLAHLGHPLIGDPKYLPRRHGFAIQGQALHSEKLELANLGGERLSFRAPLPEDMQKIISKLRQGG